MDAGHGKEGALRERKARAEQALALIDTEAARQLAVELDDCVVALNEAEAAAGRAEPVARAQAEARAAEADLGAVVAVIPFMVRSFDPAHLPGLPKAESFTDTTMDYHWAHLLPALRRGGKFSVLMADALEAALGKRDKARRHLQAVGAHGARARDREALARKELTAAVHKAEVFIHANTAPDDPARQIIKRKARPDPRTPEEKAAAAKAKADRQLARAKAIAAKKAERAARKGGAAPPAAPTPPEAANDAPAPSPKAVGG